MSEFKFRNESEKDFVDISSESFRIYHYPDGKSLEISFPKFLHVSKSGGHRIVDVYDNCYYIKPEWRYIHWKPDNGRPHFVK